MITVKEQFGKRLKSIRGSRSWTQENLAEKMDISSNYISSIERGQENPTFDMLVKFSKALGIEMEELFNFGHEVTPQKLRGMLSEFINEAGEEKLRLLAKITKAVII